MPVCYNTSYRRPSTRQLQHIDAPFDALESSLDGDNLSILRGLRRRALTHSLAVYLVGGPVRDVLMGLPIKDLDFAVEGDGPAVARELATELGGEVLVHARFGTATLVLGENRADIVTARQETYPEPAALPVVSTGDISDDLARRDFSINALALPLKERQPQVLDIHSGLDDLRLGLVRTLHPNSFVDDPTRIFRAVRYEQRLEFKIKDESLAQLRDATTQGYLGSLTADRIRHELERILQEEKPEVPLGRLAELGILTAIHPLLGDDETSARLAAVSKGEIERGPVLSQDAGTGPLIFVSALIYQLSSAEGEAVIHRLNMPPYWAQVVRETINIRGLESKLAGDALPRSELAQLLEGFGVEALQAVSRLTGSPMVAQSLEVYLNELRSAGPAVSGHDLLAMGVPEGPAVGKVLRELRDAKLNGQVSTEAEERRLAQEIITRQESLSGHG